MKQVIRHSPRQRVRQALGQAARNAPTVCSKLALLLEVMTFPACVSQPQAARVPPPLKFFDRKAQISATTCRPEQCYIPLGEVKYVEPLLDAVADSGHMEAVEKLKALALGKYPSVDALIRLEASKDLSSNQMVISGEAVQWDQGGTQTCVLQMIAAKVFNLDCDSSREGMLGDAAEYERLYNSLP